MDPHAGLATRSCKPCEGGAPPLDAKNADLLLEQLDEWYREGSWIHRDYRFRDFKTVIDFVRDVADLAEDEGHHPDLHITGYRNLRISLTTHAIDGLSDNDFILAAKVDRLHDQTR